MSSGFSANSEDAISRELKLHGSRNLCQGDENLQEAYEVDRCVSWIRASNAKKVALQFPDELLVDAPDVALDIQRKSDSEVYILGDTTYGSCCVDELSAEHVGADSLIHFGHACLSQNIKLPVLYVFEKLKIEKDPFCSAFRTTFNQSDKIIFASDLRYDGSAKGLINDELHPNLIHLKPQIPSENEEKGNICVAGRSCTLPAEFPIDSWTVLYIGEEGITLTNLMFSLNRCVFYTYNPKTRILRKETLDVNQQLRKRYYLIEKTKDAKLIGILVATLGVAEYLDIIERIKALVTNAGKKFYTIVVGKLNPSKLANFPEIDCYVVVACPENSLIDSREFYRPVITPFELEVALNSDRPWTGDYITDFRQLLPGASGYIGLKSKSEETDPDISLITGRARTLAVWSEASYTETSNGELVAPSASALSTLPTASDYLSKRLWQGLNPRVGETPVQIATSGRRGIAAGYQDEGDSSVEARGNPDGQE